MKSQTLPFEYGDAIGPYYWAWGASGYINQFPDIATEKFCRDKYVLGQANATSWQRLITANGYQDFESSERKQPLFNDCYNLKLRGFNLPWGLTGRSHLSASYFNVMPYRRLPQPTQAYNYVKVKPVLEASVWEADDSVSRRAWWTMQPRFEGKISLLNAIFELKDFRDIARHLVKFPYRNIADGMQSLKRVVSKASRAVKRNINDVKIGELPQLLKNYDYATRGLASLYLTKRLAIDPTIHDIVTIHAQLGRLIQVEQDNFQKQGKLTNRSHYRERLSFSDNTTTYTDWRFWYKESQRSELTFNATLEYLYDYKNRKPMEAFRRFWGLDLNALVVWNSLPFTWVCDFVFTIADSIASMSTDPNVVLLAQQYCESILQKLNADFRTSGDSRTFWLCIDGQMVPGSQADIPICGYERTHYKRRVVEPNRGSATPKFRWPTAGQTNILAALMRCYI
jgi:hypothetical protein